ERQLRQIDGAAEAIELEAEPEREFGERAGERRAEPGGVVADAPDHLRRADADVLVPLAVIGGRRLDLDERAVAGGAVRARPGEPERALDPEPLRVVVEGDPRRRRPPPRAVANGRVEHREA